MESRQSDLHLFRSYHANYALNKEKGRGTVLLKPYALVYMEVGPFLQEN
jgi:hypothetical protein